MKTFVLQLYITSPCALVFKIIISLFWLTLYHIQICKLSILSAFTSWKGTHIGQCANFINELGIFARAYFTFMAKVNEVGLDLDLVPIYVHTFIDLHFSG